MDDERLTSPHKEVQAELPLRSPPADVDRHRAEDDVLTPEQAARQLLDAFPDVEKHYLRLAKICRKLGRPLEGLAVIDRGLARLGDDAILLKTAIGLSTGIAENERAIRYCLRLAELPGERAECMARIATLRLHLFDGRGAQQALEAAVAAGRPPDTLRFEFARAALLREDYRACRSLLAEEEMAHGPSREVTTLRAKADKRGPLVARAIPPIRLRSTTTSELQAWAASEAIPVHEVGAAADHYITPLGDMVVRRCLGSRSLLLLFGGVAAMVGGSLSPTHHAIKRANINAIKVSDPKRLAALGGFASIGEYPATIAWIRQLAGAWDISHIYCVGYSLGGYPAIRYGLDLDARRVMTFAAPTTSTRSFVDSKVDRRGTALLNRMLHHVPHMCVNLRGEIERKGDSAPEIINYYGDAMPEDAYHARNLAGLPTVSLRPEPGLSTHAIQMALMADGRYMPALEELIRDRV